MRQFIFVLSLIFYLSSAIITYIALTIPSKTSFTKEELSDKWKQEESFSPELPSVEELDVQPEEGHDNNQAIVNESSSPRAQQKETKAETEEERALTTKPLSDNTINHHQQSGKVIAVIGGGLFSSHHDMISDELREAVKAIVPQIMALSDNSVSVEGHTDTIPVRAEKNRPYKDNYDLSFFRAKAVALLLEKYGVPKERISIIGFGDTHPRAPNSTPQGRAQNRRVEIRLIPNPE
jgi:flagellar motor protein MotB